MLKHLSKTATKKKIFCKHSFVDKNENKSVLFKSNATNFSVNVFLFVDLSEEESTEVELPQMMHRKESFIDQV